MLSLRRGCRKNKAFICIMPFQFPSTIMVSCRRRKRRERELWEMREERGRGAREQVEEEERKEMYRGDED